MVKNVKKENYPQRYTQKVKNKTKPNYPSPPPPTHPVHKTQDRHNNELPGQKLKLHETSTNDRKKKVQNSNVKWANSNPQEHALKNQDQKKIF